MNSIRNVGAFALPVETPGAGAAEVYAQQIIIDTLDGPSNQELRRQAAEFRRQAAECHRTVEKLRLCAEQWGRQETEDLRWYAEQCRQQMEASRREAEALLAYARVADACIRQRQRASAIH